ncbi:hypothetical protein GCM10028895_34220 [Pontibacter rugosus]
MNFGEGIQTKRILFYPSVGLWVNRELGYKIEIASGKLVARYNSCADAPLTVAITLEILSAI